MAFYPQYGYQSPYYPQPVPDMGRNQWQQVQNPQQLPVQTAPAVQQQAQPANPQNSGIIWVNSQQEANNYLVAPGGALALWDINNPVVYLRQSDNTGKPSTKIFDLVERSEEPKTNAAAQVCQITREEFDTVVERLTALENKSCKCETKTRAKTKEDVE